MGLLEFKNVSKHFGGIRATDGLSLTVEKNKVYGIIGPNGAGKTTIFNLITGFLKPEEGDVVFKGVSVMNMKPHNIVKMGICRSYQELRLFGRLKVVDNVYLGFSDQKYDGLLKCLFGKGFAGSEERRRNLEKASSLLKISNLFRHKESLAESLSFGEQKFLMVDRILATGAELVLLDEPTAGLDAAQIEDMLGIIRKLHSENKTVLVVEHNIDVIMTISDYIFVLDQGRKVAEGTPKEIYENEQVLETYLGE